MVASYAIAINALTIDKGVNCTRYVYSADGVILTVKAWTSGGYTTRLQYGVFHADSVWLKGDTLEECVANAVTFLNAYSIGDDMLMMLVQE